MNALLPKLLRQYAVHKVFFGTLSQKYVQLIIIFFYKKYNISATPLSIHTFLTLDRDSFRLDTKRGNLYMVCDYPRTFAKY